VTNGRITKVHIGKLIVSKLAKIPSSWIVQTTEHGVISAGRLPASVCGLLARSWGGGTNRLLFVGAAGSSDINRLKISSA